MSWIKAVFISDTHAPYHSESCMALVYDYLAREKPELVIFGGDLIDCYWLSKFVKTNQRYQGVKYEVESGKMFLEKLRKACGSARVVYLEGNHEFRLVSYLALRAQELFEAAIPELSIKFIYNLEKLGIEYIPTKNGKSAIYRYAKHLTFAHGWFTSGAMSNTAARRMLNTYGDCIIFGHAHRASLEAPAYGNGDVRFAMGAGCLCEAPTFMEVDTWNRGFISLRINTKTDQFSTPQEHRIIKMTQLYTPEGSLEAYKDKSGVWKCREI